MHGIRSLQTYLERYFVKQVLVLFATVLILIPEVYAQDDKLIDGIKFRYGAHFTTYEFELDNRNVASKHGGINTEIDKYTGWAGKSKFPIIITFPETASRWTFRQPYYDFVINDKINDIPPDHRPGYETQLKRSDSKSVNLVQIPERRVYLKEKFLPKFLSSSQISNLPSD